MELNEMQTTVIIVMSIGLILGIGLFILGTFQTTAFTNSTSTTTNQTILTSSTDTLTPIDIGITSSEVKANNLTWLEFDGVDDVVSGINFTSLYFEKNDSYSFSVWINAKDNSTKQHIIGRSVNDEFFIQGEGINWQYYNGTDAEVIASSNVVDINTWYNFVFVNNGTDRFIYRNGILLNTDPMTLGGSILSSDDIRIGGYFSFFNGSIDNIQVYPRELTTNEILEIYNGGRNFINNSFIIEKLELGENNVRGMAVNSSGTLYVYNETLDKVQKTSDDGSTWITVSPKIGFTSRMMFIDSEDTIFLDASFNGSLWMSQGNDTNWTRSLNYTCGVNGLNGSAWSMTEDTENNILYVGQYSFGASSENCTMIWNSSDGGNTWGVAFNASAEPIIFPLGSRHVHNIKYNPYNGYVYAGVGDGANRSGVLRFNGTKWDLVLNESNPFKTGHEINIIGIGFTEEYRLYGEDNTCAEIFRTSDDINYESVYEPFGDDCGFVWTASENLETNYFGYTTSISGQLPMIIATNDGGDSFQIVHSDASTSGTFEGIWTISNFVNNTAYFTNTTGIVKFSALDFSNANLIINLNENSGTTAHDTSGNSWNGTLVGIPVWATDGLFVTLTAIIDYTINPTTGLFTIVNTDYSWSELLVEWNYGTITDSIGYSSITTVRAGLADFADWIAIIVVVIAAAIVLTLVIRSFGGKRNII